MQSERIQLIHPKMFHCFYQVPIIPESGIEFGMTQIFAKFPPTDHSAATKLSGNMHYVTSF